MSRDRSTEELDQSTDEVGQEIPENVSAIRWAWSQGWRGKANVILVTLAVIIMTPVAKVYNAVEDAYEAASGE